MSAHDPTPESNAFAVQTHWGVSLPILAVVPNTPINQGLRAVFLSRALNANLAIEAPARLLPILSLIDGLLTTTLESLEELDTQDADESGFSQVYTREFHAVLQHLNTLPLIDLLQSTAVSDSGNG